MADQWLSWRLDVIASFLILIVALLAVSQRGTLSPSLTALSLSQVRSQARLLYLLRVSVGQGGCGLQAKIRAGVVRCWM